MINFNFIKYIGAFALVGLLFMNTALSQPNVYANQTNKGFQKGAQPKVSVSLSTAFNSYGYGLNGLSTSIMPKVSFPVSNKFAITAGIGYSSIFMNNNSASVFNSAPTSYGHVFVSGDYLLTDKITLRGTAYKTFRLGQPQTDISNDMGSPFYDFSSQGVIMDVEYKVNDKFRINVGFEYREQKYPMYGPGFHPGMSSFGNNGSFFDFNHSHGINQF